MADRGLRYAALDFGAESGRTIVGRFDGDQLSIEPVHRYANTPVRSCTGTSPGSSATSSRACGAPRPAVRWRR